MTEETCHIYIENTGNSAAVVCFAMTLPQRANLMKLHMQRIPADCKRLLNTNNRAASCQPPPIIKHPSMFTL